MDNNVPSSGSAGVLLDEESPKRRSTFYVSLDGESRHLQAKIPKTSLSSVNGDSGFICNTFPTCHHTGSGGVGGPNSRRTLNGGGSVSTLLAKREQDIAEGSQPIPAGKVQSLSRIFEQQSPQVKTSDNQKTKKIERARSFKTIERFQNRFTNRKQTQSSSSQENDAPKKENQTTNDRGGEEEEEEEAAARKVEENGKPGTPNHGEKKLSSRVKPVELKIMPKQNVSLTSLIRRTHSTKLTRSSSALVRATAGKYYDECNPKIEYFGSIERRIAYPERRINSNDRYEKRNDDKNDREDPRDSNEERERREDGVHSGSLLF